MPFLHHISLSHNPKLNKNSITQLLKTEDFIERISHLYLANLTANSQNLPIDSIINHADNISLIEFDISANNYSDIDLNGFLFNQAKFGKLQV